MEKVRGMKYICALGKYNLLLGSDAANVALVGGPELYLLDPELRPASS